jgi:geranylgeranyl diphosphate synthase type I
MRIVAEGAPEALRTTVTAATEGEPDLLSSRLALETAGAASAAAEATWAATAVGLLEAAQHLRASVHGLDAATPGRRPSNENVASGLASAWLSARCIEVAAELGGTASLRASNALPGIAQGWILEALDLYDAGRAPDRCIRAASATRGGVYSLAAALGGLVAGCEEADVETLARCGEAIGASAKACDDARGLVPALAPGVRAGTDIASGVYGLPVAYAVRSEPKLAESLGGAVKDEQLGDLLARIRSAGGLAQTAVYCGRVSAETGDEAEGLDQRNALAALAAEIAGRCEEAALA